MTKIFFLTEAGSVRPSVCPSYYPFKSYSTVNIQEQIPLFFVFNYE